MPEPETRTLNNLPEKVQDFLFDPVKFDQVGKIREEYDLPETAEDSLLNLAQDTLFGIYDIKSLPTLISVEFDLNDELAKKASADLVGYRLLPLSGYFGDVSEQITKWGGDLSKFKDLKKVAIEGPKMENMVQKLLQELGLTFSDEPMQHRLEYIMTGFAGGERDVESTKQILQRDAKVGGLELDKETAEKVVAMFQEKMPQKEEVSKVSEEPSASEESLEPPLPEPEIAVTEPAEETEDAEFEEIKAAEEKIEEIEAGKTGEAVKGKGLAIPALNEAPSVLPTTPPVDIPAAPEPPVREMPIEPEPSVEVEPEPQPLEKEKQVESELEPSDKTEPSVETEPVPAAERESQPKIKSALGNAAEPENKPETPPEESEKSETAASEASKAAEPDASPEPSPFSESASGTDPVIDASIALIAKNSKSEQKEKEEKPEQEDMPGPGATEAPIAATTTKPAAPAKALKMPGKQKKDELEELKKESDESKGSEESSVDNAAPGKKESSEEKIAASAPPSPPAPLEPSAPKTPPKTGAPNGPVQAAPQKAEPRTGVGAPPPVKAAYEEEKKSQPLKDLAHDTFGKAEEDEIEEIAKQTQAKAAELKPVVDVKTAVQRVNDEVKLSFTYETRKKFSAIVESRIRGIRNPYETRTQLENSPEQGGLGIKGKDLADVMQTVEKAYDEFQKTPYAKALHEREEAKGKKADKEKELEQLDAQEKNQLAQRYAELTGLAPTEHIEPITARTTAAHSRREELKRKDEKIDKEKVKQAVENAKKAPQAVTPRYSAGSVPVDAKGRPKVQDVKFVRKLAGPVEELRMMTLTDFRRLSRDPKEAILKIQDKIDLLEADGYDKKIAGIKAWRESFLNQLYVSITTESLNAGKPISDILKEHAAKGAETLSQDEINAIIALNGKLRF